MELVRIETTSKRSLPKELATIVQMSDTARYKQCGNGIVAPMVTAIIEKMEDCLHLTRELNDMGGVE